METADRMFAQRGTVATLNEIAHEAGVGVGTVYRRFPDLQALVDALFTERFSTFLQLAAAAEEFPDPGRALRHYLLEAARRRAQDRALEVILAHADVAARPIAGMRDDLGRHVDGLAERAVAAGAVREDFAAADVYAFLLMIGTFADRTEDVAPDAWRRYAELLLTGFGLARDPDNPEDPTAPVAHPPAMTDAQALQIWPKPGRSAAGEPSGRPGAVG
jgi:AcrR family transcriptional regulator